MIIKSSTITGAWIRIVPSGWQWNVEIKVEYEPGQKLSSSTQYYGSYSETFLFALRDIYLYWISV